MSEKVYERLEKYYGKAFNIEPIEHIYEKTIPYDVFYYLRDSVNELLSRRAMYTKTTNPEYETLGLTYNPYLDIDGYKQYSHNLPLGAHGRDDTHAFVRPLPESEFLYNICEFTPVRAKITRMSGRFTTSEWHYDEPIDECIKVIIPTKTDNECYFQYENHKPIRLEIGKAYFFDSSFHHRFIYGNCETDEVHIVFGLSTKFSYDYSRNHWYYDEDRSKKTIKDLIDESVMF